MRDLTLRQIEVVRAVMMTGTITGAAAFLNVSAPGVSRLLKYTEESIGIRLFERKAGLFIPSVEAAAVFDQVRQVHHSVDNLNTAVASLQKGQDVRLAFASSPSIAQFIAARALRTVRRKLPDLYIDLNILKIEETMDYLLLERGEFVIMSSAVESATVESTELARGVVVAIVPDDHPLAKQDSVSVHDLASEPFIGVDPTDPYGAALARPFRAAGINIQYSMRGRFAQTVVSLVRHGLGVAVIDEFSVAEVYMPGLTRLRLRDTSPVAAFVCKKKGRVLSGFAEFTIAQFKVELTAATRSRPWEKATGA